MLVPVLLIACGDTDTGLSRADVAEKARSELAEQSARSAVASIPPKSAPADYTRFFVNKAIS